MSHGAYLTHNMIYALAALTLCFLSVVRFAHIFQLEGYKPREYRKWLAEHVGRGIWKLVLAALLCIAAPFSTAIPFVLSLGGALLPVFLFQYTAELASLLLLLFYYLGLRIKNAKKPIVYTARMKRMLVTVGVILLFWLALCFLVTMPAFGLIPMLTPFIGIALLLTPVHILAANFINRPIEKAIANGYLNDAKNRLAARTDMIVIGITGSYGKTSTKFILGAILGEKYSVLVPPSSYNTPMGLTRVIREQMTDEHQVFLAEMGAKQKGDIAELCDLAHPQYGIITSVGPQHLETFGSIETVAATKYELIEGLPADGVAFFPNDGGIVQGLYERTSLKKRSFAVDAPADVTARDITVTPEGSRFTLVKADGAELQCATRLLGRHNIQNILGAAAVAIELGLTDEELAAGIAKIEPVEHRLQLIPTGNGVTVIDDAFNSNPAGARAAMDVIAAFPGRKIVVTPGMIELGASEDAENRAFGRYMADKADIVYLIGPKHTRPIYEGLIEGGFDPGAIVVTGTLDEASAAMGQILRVGDVVIFENDLPDNYNE